MTRATRSCLSALAAVAVGCGAPPVEPARELSFTDYPYTPVGAYAVARHADRGLPYLDVDGDGQLDLGVEPTGRCDASGSCRIDDAQIRVVSRTSGCEGRSGVWWDGTAYDRAGAKLPATLCDVDHGTCSEDHSGLFRDTASDNGLWEPAPAPVGDRRTVALRVGDRELRQASIEVPEPLLLPEPPRFTSATTLSVTADRTIDLAAVWMTRDGAQVWASTPHRGMFHADGATLTATLPPEAVAACGDTCDTFVSVAHVWRDDAVRVTSDVVLRAEPWGQVYPNP